MITICTTPFWAHHPLCEVLLSAIIPGWSLILMKQFPCSASSFRGGRERIFWSGRRKRRISMGKHGIAKGQGKKRNVIKVYRSVSITKGLDLLQSILCNLVTATSVHFAVFLVRILHGVDGLIGSSYLLAFQHLLTSGNVGVTVHFHWLVTLKILSSERHLPKCYFRITLLYRVSALSVISRYQSSVLVICQH